jgi:DNA-binding phage protein
MSSLKSDEYIRRAAEELHIDESLLRDSLNTADPDELLQRAAGIVVDGRKEVGAVARIFEVDEEHLGRAVWFMKENRQRRTDENLRQAAAMVVDSHENLAEVARYFAVDEEHLGRAVWFMKENREREARRREQNALIRDQAERASAETARYLLENPPS